MSLILSVDGVAWRLSIVTTPSLSVDGDGDWGDWMLLRGWSGVWGWLLVADECIYSLPSPCSVLVVELATCSLRCELRVP